MEKGKLWGFFKRCQSSSKKIAPTDGHSLCLFCLGDTHNVETCTICSRFSKQAKRNRAARLGVFLLEQSLKPKKSPMEAKSSKTSVSASNPTVGTDPEPTQVSGSKSGHSTPKSGSARTDQRPTALMEPLKVVLPVSSRQTSTTASKAEKSAADDKRDKPDKQKKKPKRDKDAKVSSAQDTEAPKKKKKKPLLDLEVSVSTLAQPGPLPPDDLFQIPTRVSMTPQTHTETVQPSPVLQGHEDSEESVVSVHSDSGSDDRLSWQSHRPTKHRSASSHSNRSS